MSNTFDTPSNARQAVELAPLAREDEDAAREVWQGLRAKHGEKVTAAVVREAVDARLGRNGMKVHCGSC